MPDNKLHTFLMSIRQALIIAIGALEDYMGMERSIVPRRKRGRQQRSEEGEDGQGIPS